MGAVFPKDELLRRKLRVLLLLPAIGIFMFLWAALFGRGMGHPELRLPEWVNYPEYGALAALLFLSVYYVYRLRGARLFVIAAAICNMYFIMAVSLTVGMIISGDSI
jgi:hypothetical protein